METEEEKGEQSTNRDTETHKERGRNGEIL